MSEIHLQHIKNGLIRRFQGKIDMSDCEGRASDESSSDFLSRAVAAYALTMLTDIDDDCAADSIVDGFDDNGIDALYYSKLEKTLYVVQSKWFEKGSKSPKRGDIQKFIKGFQDLTNGRMNRFSDKVRSKEPDIMLALEDASSQFCLIIAYTGDNPLSRTSRTDLDDLMRELNYPSDIARLEVIDQARIHASLANQTAGMPINIEVQISNWGVVAEPYQAYYGTVSAEEIGKWWVEHRNRLFRRNIRGFKGRSEVNDAIKRTAYESPSKFWYFNNGLTVLCDSIRKKPLGGASRDSGVFECTGVSVVNGAQTVGSIGEAYSKAPDEVRHAYVLVRFISLEDRPESLSADITIAANTQNMITSRDFAALDPEQDRLQQELSLEGKQYVLRSGEPLPKEEDGFGIEEATVALACASGDLGLVVQAKREIGRLWDTSADPSNYRKLFGPHLTGNRLLRVVEVFRAIETEIDGEKSTREGRERQTVVHGNRFIAFCAFEAIPRNQLFDPEVELLALRQKAGALVHPLVNQICGLVDEMFENSYLQSLFKNKTKCENLMERVRETQS